MLRYQRSLIDVSDDEINVENEATGQHSNIHISFSDRTMNDNTEQTGNLLGKPFKWIQKLVDQWKIYMICLILICLSLLIIYCSIKYCLFRRRTRSSKQNIIIQLPDLSTTSSISKTVERSEKF